MSDAEGTSSRRALSWVVILLGTALIGAAAFVLLTMGDDELTAPDPPGPAPVEDPAEPPPPEDDTPVVVTYDVLLTRDPFFPVRPEDPGGEDPDAEDPDVEDPGVQTPGVQDPGVEDPDVEDPDTDDGDTTTPADLPIVVFETDTDSAVIQVGDRIFDVTVGQTFADRHQLTAIVDGCARIRDTITARVRTVCPTQESFK